MPNPRYGHEQSHQPHTRSASLGTYSIEHIKVPPSNGSVTGDSNDVKYDCVPCIYGIESRSEPGDVVDAVAVAGRPGRFGLCAIVALEGRHATGQNARHPEHTKMPQINWSVNGDSNDVRYTCPTYICGLENRSEPGDVVDAGVVAGAVR
jgi:hypothetical protein